MLEAYALPQTNFLCAIDDLPLVLSFVNNQLLETLCMGSVCMDYFLIPLLLRLHYYLLSYLQLLSVMSHF